MKPQPMPASSIACLAPKSPSRQGAGATVLSTGAHPLGGAPVDPRYDANHEVRRVRPAGQIKWRGDEILAGEAFAGELFGLAGPDTGGHIVRFASRDLGVIS